MPTLEQLRRKLKKEEQKIELAVAEISRIREEINKVKQMRPHSTVTHYDVVLDFLKNDLKLRKDIDSSVIMTITGISRECAASLLSRMTSDGVLVRTGFGKYRLNPATTNKKIPVKNNKTGKILNYLQENGVSRLAAIVKNTNIETSNCNVLVNDLVKQGLVRKVARGIYAPNVSA